MSKKIEKMQQTRRKIPNTGKLQKITKRLHIGRRKFNSLKMLEFLCIPSMFLMKIPMSNIKRYIWNISRLNSRSLVSTKENVNSWTFMMRIRDKSSY
jgi:hypothetical protein